MMMVLLATIAAAATATLVPTTGVTTSHRWHIVHIDKGVLLREETTLEQFRQQKRSIFDDNLQLVIV